MTSEVNVDVGGVTLAADWTVPERAVGAVVFAHGSGSSRFSERNRFVAHELYKAGLASLLLDLFTTDEEAVDNVSGALRFDVPFLARRVVAGIDWAARALPAGRIGLFGASTGAAAALVAATARPVSAVVSRGGRPDLAAGALPLVRAPTLLIVGGEDTEVLGLNRQALRSLSCEKELVIVGGATHLFEEAGALEKVAGLASRWFIRHFGAKADVRHEARRG